MTMFSVTINDGFMGVVLPNGKVFDGPVTVDLLAEDFNQIAQSLFDDGIITSNGSVSGGSAQPTWISTDRSIPATQGGDLAMGSNTIWYRLDPVTGPGGGHALSIIISTQIGAAGTPGQPIIMDFTALLAGFVPAYTLATFDIGPLAGMGSISSDDGSAHWGPYALAGDFTPMLTFTPAAGDTVATAPLNGWLGVTLSAIILEGA